MCKEVQSEELHKVCVHDWLHEGWLPSQSTAWRDLAHRSLQHYEEACRPTSEYTMNERIYISYIHNHDQLNATVSREVEYGY